MKRIIITAIIFILATIMGFAIEESIKDLIWFNNLVGIMKIILENIMYVFIGLGIIFIAILWIYWKLKDFRKEYFDMKKHILYLSVKLKYYDIMLTKFHDKYKGHPCTVFDEDINLFSKEEQNIYNEYLKNLEKLKIIMKGKNKAMGMFM